MARDGWWWHRRRASNFTALAHAADVEGFAIASRAPEPGVLVVLAESMLSACTLAR
ncbi:MAG TPA: hypothetical protein PLS90_01365 [Candidatus Sumerlaeota bacterium]|nr:hypothetical protein [Candidatus Sumerlaeota bacterium]